MTNKLQKAAEEGHDVDLSLILAAALKHLAEAKAKEHLKYLIIHRIRDSLQMCSDTPLNPANRFHKPYPTIFHENSWT
jgi:hypothetical protein